MPRKPKDPPEIPFKERMAQKTEADLRAGTDRIERERQQFLELQKIKKAAEEDERKHRESIAAEERRLIDDKARAQRELEKAERKRLSDEEKQLKQWDREYKRQDREKARQQREEKRAADRLERDLQRNRDKAKRDAEKLARDQQRDADKLAKQQVKAAAAATRQQQVAANAAARAQKQQQAAATKAQNVAARVQKQQQTAAARVQKQQQQQAQTAIKQQNQTLLQGLQNRNNMQQAAANGAIARQRALNSIASNVQSSINQQARRLAISGGPAGRARAARLLNVTGPTMIQQAQQAYLNQQNAGANAASMGAGGGRPTNAAMAGAAGGGRAAPPAPPPPPPRPSLLSRAASGLESRVDRARQVRDDYREVNSGDMLDKLSMALKGNGKLVAAGAAASAATAGLGLAAGSTAGAIGLLKTVFMSTWNYIDTKVLPTTSMLNRALGATTPGMKSLRNEAMSTALQFERLGLGFEHGAQTAKDLALGLKQASIPKGLMNSLVKVSEYVGVGGEQAGALGRSFLSTGATTQNLGATIDTVMHQSAKAAREFGVPINMVRKEFAENIDLVQRWGTNNTEAFNRAIAKAESYGLSIRELEGTFGKSLDTFESTSDVASKLNAAFGTNLDSVKLLMMNSSDRMEAVRNAVTNTSFEWDHASVFAKNLLMSTLKIKDETEGASIFGSQKDRKAALARIADQKMIASGMDEWKRALGSLGTQLTSVEQLTRNLFMAIGNVVAKLLGFESGIDATKRGVKGFETFMDNLTGKINDFAKSMPTSKTGAGSAVVEWVNDLSKSLASARDLVRDVRNYFEDLTTLGEGGASSIANEFEDLFRNGGSPEQFAAVKSKMHDSSFFHPKQRAMAQSKIQRDLGLTPEQTAKFLEKPVEQDAQAQALALMNMKAMGLPLGIGDPSKLTLQLIVSGDAFEVPILGGAVKRATGP